MKSFATIVLLGSASAVSVQTSCEKHQVPGVTCAPANEELWAVGGEHEELDQNILIKGNQFRYVQTDAETEYVDGREYSAHAWPLFPGTVSPNFWIKHRGKCLTWADEFRSDVQELLLKPCTKFDAHQYWTFDQHTRSIRAYQRTNACITAPTGTNFVGASYPAVLQPWSQETYQIINMNNPRTPGCTFTNDRDLALQFVNGKVQWGPCVSGISYWYLDEVKPGDGRYHQ